MTNGSESELRSVRLGEVGAVVSIPSGARAYLITEQKKLGVTEKQVIPLGKEAREGMPKKLFERILDALEKKDKNSIKKLNDAIAR